MSFLPSHKVMKFQTNQHWLSNRETHTHKNKYIHIRVHTHTGTNAHKRTHTHTNTYIKHPHSFQIDSQGIGQFRAIAEDTWLMCHTVRLNLKVQLLNHIAMPVPTHG